MSNILILRKIHYGVWSNQPASLCIFGETLGTALALDYNGDRFSCDYYVEPNYLLGNSQELDRHIMVWEQK